MSRAYLSVFSTTMSAENDPFYLRYYTGHSGKHGHEFLEFEYSHGRLRYANNSNYRNDSLIRKEMWVGPLVVKELKRIVESSEIVKEDDTNWPKKNIVGKQELEIRVGNDHIAFETAKIGSLVDIQDSEDPEGLRVFYYLVQDLKAAALTVSCIVGGRPIRCCFAYTLSRKRSMFNIRCCLFSESPRLKYARYCTSAWVYRSTKTTASESNIYLITDFKILYTQ
uniref:Mago nashi protein n=1 Tax=Mycena chlorophos TaxID=658473 RepID=A0ABQ0M8H6_MYCCL|nr:predicted protein [Mycena chlorophos]